MSKWTDSFERSRADLEAARPTFADAIARLNDGRIGTPAASGGIGASSGGSSSPVERAVVGRPCVHDDPTECDCTNGTTPDPARATLVQVNKALRRLEHDTAFLLSVARTAAPHTPTAKDLREVAAANYAEPECALCRVQANVFAPVHRSGRCRWCYDFVRSQGRVPSKDESQRHHDGLQVRVKA